MMRFKLALSTVVLATCVTAGAALAQGRCDLQSIRAIAPKDAVVDSVRALGAPTPHCEIIGHTITTNPGPNRVGWSLLLPDNRFGGRYYFIGQGGGAGQIITASPDTSTMALYMGDAAKLLNNGFAVATSDTGHRDSLSSWDWGANEPVKRLDFSHRGRTSPRSPPRPSPAPTMA